MYCEYLPTVKCFATLQSLLYNLLHQCMKLTVILSVLFVQLPGVSTLTFFTLISDAHLVSMNQYLFSSREALFFFLGGGSQSTKEAFLSFWQCYET